MGPMKPMKASKAMKAAKAMKGGKGSVMKAIKVMKAMKAKTKDVACQTKAHQLINLIESNNLIINNLGGPGAQGSWGGLAARA